MIFGGYAPYLIAAVHIFSAGLVTAHVLLEHRAVRSSIGWIGMAWLSPVFGAALYYAFGVNRVARRASRYTRATAHKPPLQTRESNTLSRPLPPRNIQQIARLGDAAVRMPLTRGNAVKFLENGDVSYEHMVAAITGAVRSVALGSYIFADDEAGSAFVDALIAAHQRGVEVRVLVDGIGGGYFRNPTVTRLSAAGVPAERFLHEWRPIRMPFLNMRNHKKILVVDGKHGFTGGMNIAADNLANGLSTHKVRDVHARIEGPVIEQLMQSFAMDWRFTTGEELRGVAWWPPLTAVGDVTMRGLPSGPDEDVGQLELILAAAVEQAEKRVRIVTPYFLPEDWLLDILGRAALRGVEVDLLIPERSNQFFLDWATRAHLAKFPVDRINCYLGGAPFDHSKLMTVDGAWCLIGSANWDARSLRLNFEFNLECYGRKTAKALDRLIDQKLAGCGKLSAEMLANRPVLARLRDASMRLLLPYL